jgi:hypothetical protein
MLKPSDFKTSQVYRMNVASRSHVKSPYYVCIKLVGKDFIETYIPGEHSLRINYPSEEWNYHIPRMEFIGDNEESRNLLFNQGNLISKFAINDPFM